MADPVISAAIKAALETALSLASDRIGMLVGFKKDLASMTRSLGFIKDVLADAEEKQNQSKGVQRWLKCLEEVAYDAQNVLDELHYESLRHQVESRNRPKLKVFSFFSFSNINLAFRWRMASKVRDINLELKEINKEAYRLGLVSRSVMTAAVGDTRSRQTDSVLAPMIGRADDESNIVKILLSPSKKVVSVLPIIGMGGLGKTTLAKSIYNNPQIDGQFKKKLWVCVSKKVAVVELFKLILGQLKDKKDEVGDRQNIVREVGKELGKLRYLLVLDDVWDDDEALWDDNQELWDDFFTTLKELNPTNGSWCLVTTRSDSVAGNVSGALMREHEAYALRKLHDEDCWSILLKKAFGEKEAPDELEQFKGRILQRCDGLPATASLIGLQLRKLDFTKKEESGSILDKLLSLHNLSSPSIKKCFAYCSMFPKDTEIERDMLIEVWMAEGFLQTDLNNEMMMEERGMNHLRILLQSWLLEEIRHDFWGVYYKMQDVAHNHAKSMSKSTKVISDGEIGIVDNGDLVRYLAVDSVGEDREELFKSLKTSLHTLFVRSSSISGDMLMKLKNLYVLNLSGAKNQMVPKSIGKLIHLRFIDFSDSGSETLPQSVCKLYNLQTLRLNSGALKALPKEMNNLISMRHLHYQNSDDKFEMPLEMGRLTCLQTLEFFNVGRKKGRQIGELGFLKNLKGKLIIRNLQLVKDRKEAEKGNLFEKPNLFRLQLEWAHDREGHNYNDEDVLNGLRPHPNLEELKIRGFMGDQFPQWSKDLPTTLPKLVSLGFDNCNRCRELPPLQNLTSLKELTIHKCVELRNLPGDMLQSCTSLQKLRVTECHNLISFPLDLHRTPSLLEVELWGCPELETSTTPQGFGFLTSLRTLSIGPFSDDDDHENSLVYNKFDWFGLTSFSSPSTSSSSSSSTLEVLKLRGLPHMETLPNQLQHLTTLKSLTLHDFGEVETLADWLGNFAALDTLCLVEVKKLRHLPDAIRSLAKQLFRFHAFISQYNSK